MRTFSGEKAPVKGQGALNVAIGVQESEHHVWVADIVEEAVVSLDKSNGKQLSSEFDRENSANKE